MDFNSKNFDPAENIFFFFNSEIECLTFTILSDTKDKFFFNVLNRFFAIVIDEPDEHTMVLALPECCTYTHPYIPAFDIKYIGDCFNTKNYPDPTQYVIESSCPIKYSKEEIFDCWFYKKKTWFDLKNVEDIVLDCLIDVQPKPKNKLPYTDEEDVAIVNYILKENFVYEVWGKLLWQLIEGSNVCKDRTWESLKERYIEHIRYELVPGTSKFSFLTPKNLNLLQQGLTINEKKEPNQKSKNVEMKKCFGDESD